MRSFAAVKVVQMSKLTKKLKENLAQEIDILKRLKHPHIVQLFSCTSTPAHIYLVMEYCQLSDLAQFMKKRHTLPTFPETADIFRKYPNPEFGGLNEVLVRHFLKQITSALQYLRASNMIHRDIKPQNLLLNPAPMYMSKQKAEDVPMAVSENSLIPAVGIVSLPMLKIADFGFARHLPSTSMAETLCGSPLYMAPEILRYEKYDARADLWSTGTVLHEMVVGKPPFRAQNHVELLRKIEKANDVIIFDNKNMVISRGMKDLIRKLLKKSPVERMTYEDLFNDPVVTGDIPNLDSEDVAHTQLPDLEASELCLKSTRGGDIERSSSERTPAPQQPRQPHDEGQRRTSLSPYDADHQQPPVDTRRRSSSGNPRTSEEAGIPIKRQSSQRGSQRPPIVAHMTAPARQEVPQPQAQHVSATRMERRPSRSSPLAGPPLVREPTLEADRPRDTHIAREAKERTAQDLMFEKEYVVIDKQAVAVNAFADELDAQPQLQARGPGSGAMVRRATTQGQPTSITGAQPASPSRTMQMVTGRTSAHQRAGSFERRYAPSPQSATNMLSKALNAANARLLGALGTSPPAKNASPPQGYSAFPSYPSAQGLPAIGNGHEPKLPLDEDGRIVRIVEEAATRSDVIFGFAEVKYRQLIPATPSSQDPLGIMQLEAQDNILNGSKDDDDDRDMTTIAIVGVAEEALVLYVKALAILTKIIDLAIYWWNKQNSSDHTPADTTTHPSNVGTRILGVVKWSRERFNECLEKSEVVGRKLQASQRKLPETHPGHPNNHASTSTTAAITTSVDQIRITSGVTAERLMFDRAVEMSRGAAVAELVGEDFQDCELGYRTSIMLLEAVLETDDEPLMRRPSAKKDKSADEIINGMESEDRQTVVKRMFCPTNRLVVIGCVSTC
jgi:serine/threonine-protein kinase ULK/ATG1